jgi:hypothetical protein
MRTISPLAAVAVIVVSLGVTASAHRVDEYLQAALISLDQEKHHVEVFLRLTPGIAVSSQVLASIDTDGDGVNSENEQRTYAQRVLSDLSLMVDGHRLTPRLVSMDFPEVEQMKEGLGEIRITFTAGLPAGGPNRRLVFENHHQGRIAAYLVNCLTPRDRNIRMIAQNRSEDQSLYQLDYVQTGERPEPLYLKWWPGVRGWNGWPVAAAILLFAVVLSIFRLLVKASIKNQPLSS